MVKPHIISKLVHSNGDEEVNKIEKSERLVSEQTINKMKELMHNVIVKESGTGYRYNIEGYDIIGKTGTAQIFENGTYANNGYILSTALMYPMDNPEIIIYAAVKRPPENSTLILSESINVLMQNIAKYRNMFNSNKITSNIEIYTIDNYLNKKVIDVKNDLEKKNINVIILGDGEQIVNQYPQGNTKVLTNDTIFLLTNSSYITMPNMYGLSRNNVSAFCNLINNNCDIQGNGYVVSQSLEAGSEINDSITFELANR